MALHVIEFSPNLGHTGGFAMVEIRGVDFRLPTPQSADPGDSLPAPPPSVRVFFGAAEAQSVFVLTTDRLIAITPEVVESEVNIEVKNIDDDGVELETFTTTDQFFFRLPQLSSDDWAVNKITDTLIDKLRSQLHPTIDYLPSPDYSDDDTEAFIYDPTTLPSVAITGPRMVENRFYSLNELTLIEHGFPGLQEFLRGRENMTHDLVFSVLGFSNSKREVGALAEAFVEVMRKMKFLPHPQPLFDLVEVDVTNPPDQSRVANQSGLRFWRAELTIRGFDLGGLPGFVDDLTSSYGRAAQDDAQLQVNETGDAQGTPLSADLPLGTPASEPTDSQGDPLFPKFGSVPT